MIIKSLIIANNQFNVFITNFPIQITQYMNKPKQPQFLQPDPPSPRFGIQITNPTQQIQSNNPLFNKPKQNKAVIAHRKISQEQLLQHKSIKSAWISLKGVVYDITQYIRYHPGGEIILTGCGKQSQQLFDQNHSWINVKSMLGHCIIGSLCQNKL